MEYEPGVCNIGKHEQRRRYMLGGIGLLAAVLWLLIYTRVPGGLYLVFLPLVLMYEGFYQGRLGFCAGFAFQGIYDTSVRGNRREEVEDEKAHKQDLIRAIQIHMYSLTSAVFTTLVIYLV